MNTAEMSSKTKYITLGILIIAIIALSWDNPRYGEVCVKGQCFNVELASTPEKRADGLMFRDHLGENEGMLFIFEEESQNFFWMKNTLIALDIIWIDSSGEIVSLYKNAQPCGQECSLVGPSMDTRYVLEVNGGTSDRLGLVEGDKVTITLP